MRESAIMTDPRVTVTWGGHRLSDRALSGAEVGLKLGAELVLQRSRDRVPNDEGTLERSGTTSYDPTTTTAAVSYDTPYAVRQHEDTSLRHQDGRSAKYLETPWRASAREVGEIVAREIRKALGT